MQQNFITILLNNSLDYGKNLYDKVLLDKKYNIYFLSLNCIDLEDPLIENSRTKYPLSSKIIEGFFTEFDSFDSNINKKNAIYIMHFDNSKFDSRHLVTTYKDAASHGRNMSAIKQNPYYHSNVLYVGKVEKDLGGRLSTHFGYASPQTGGLQLKYWARGLSLELSITLIIFDEDLGSYLNPLEMYFVQSLNPLLGRSRT